MYENTAWGCAVAAGLAVGLWDGVECIMKQEETKMYVPEWKPEFVDLKRREWKSAVEKSFHSIFIA